MNTSNHAVIASRIGMGFILSLTFILLGSVLAL